MSPAAPSRLQLRLYIAGDYPNSQRALQNLREMFAAGDIDLEVVDCLEDPARGLHDGIYVTPCLLKLAPKPTRTILGDLSNRTSVMEALMSPPTGELR